MTESKNHPNQPPPTLIPIKTSTCPSLTDTSKISYKIASDTSSAIHLQILKNSNTGKFSEEWIAYSDAKAALPIGSFSSAPLRNLYRNKSLNTPGFLLAVMLHEGVVEREPGKRMLFRFKSDEAFLADIQELVAAKIDVSDATQSAKSSSRKRK